MEYVGNDEGVADSRWDTYAALAKNPTIVSTAVVALGVVFGSLAYTGTFSGFFANKNTAPEIAQDTTSQKINETDENVNGIPDWQELSIENTDSTTAGAQTEPAAPTREELEKKFTKTELLAGDLFGPYFERKEAEVYSSTDNEAIVANALAGLDITKIPQFTEADIRVIQNDPTDKTGDRAAAKYRDSIKNILTSLDAIPEYELQIYARATEKNDAAEFKKVSDAADTYSSMVAELKTVNVPDGAVGAHLALMNSFTKVSLALLEMSKGYDDIAGSYSALKTFGDAEKDMHLANTLHTTYLAIHNAIDL